MEDITYGKNSKVESRFMGESREDAMFPVSNIKPDPEAKQK